MNVEENRLKTFTEWPANAPVEATRIAQAGFYYTGNGLEVQCFLCGVKIFDWNYGDQAIARHRQARDDCPFVLNPRSTCNVPLISGSSSSLISFPTPSSSSSSSSSSTVASEAREVSQINVATVGSECDLVHIKYRFMSERLKTFSNWPKPSIISPESLAKAGFYYLQRNDVVECAFCRGIIRNWQAGDDPDREHRIHFPNCDFYMHQDATDGTSFITLEDLELNNVTVVNGTTSNLRELGIQPHIAPKRNGKCATYEGRLKTFQGWPQDLNQTPEMLASAGFYYIGTGDEVRCFHCDGGLRNWETTDDVWVEHAKWFPKCGYVNLVRGYDFIKQCIDKRPSLESVILGISETENKAQSETVSSIPTKSQKTEVSEAIIEELLHSAPAMEALQVGLQLGRVKKVIKNRMESVGIPYTNADQLIVDVVRELCTEDENESDDQSPDSPSSELIDLMNQVTTTQVTNESANVYGSKSNCDNNDTEKFVDNKVKESKGLLKENSPSQTKTNAKLNETESLKEENRKLKEARLCKICMDQEVAVVFLPCGHLATCVQCAPSLTRCPLCRQEIHLNVRTFLS